MSVLQASGLPMALCEALKTRRNRNQLLAQLTGRGQCVKHLHRVPLPVVHSSPPVSRNLPDDKLAEALGDGALRHAGAKLPPGLIVDAHPRHVITSAPRALSACPRSLPSPSAHAA